MIEVLWHGRGGQGAFTAARLLGAASSLADGAYAMAFPSFGPERRGAPMRAFTKMDSRPIGDRSALAKADFVVYLDETLLTPDFQSQLKPGGIALVNSSKNYAGENIICLDANGISKRILGREIPNTTFLAAISCMCDALTPEDAKEAIRQYMAPKLHDKNIAIVDEVVSLVAQGFEPGADQIEASGEQSEDAGAPREAPDRIIPTLRSGQLDPAVFARNTCWDAGHLVTKNAGWRIVRPVFDYERCTNCLQCYMNCPDGTIRKQGDSLVFDYDFCKGCGVCAKVCRLDAIAMVPERSEN